jgi:hypothetical protein
MTTEPYRLSGPDYHGAMALHHNSRAFDPSYRPTRSLAQLAAAMPANQFLADRLAEQRDAKRIAHGKAWVERLKATLKL